MPTIITKTIKSSGGDYATLAAAISGEVGIRPDLVANDEQLTFECYGMVDTSLPNVNGFTTDSTRYVRVVAAPGAKAKMPWDTGAYIIRRTSGGGGVLTLSDPYTRVEDIQVESTVNHSAGSCTLIGSGAVPVYVKGCIVRYTGSLTGGTLDGIFHSTASGEMVIVNCVALGKTGTRYGIGVSSGGGGGAQIQNCTSINWGTANLQASTGVVVAKNCLGAGGATNDFGGTWDGASTNNASTDSSAPGGSPRTSQTFSFVGSPTDLHLAAGDGGAKDFGVDLSTDGKWPGNFNDDFDRIVRSGTWDIGADEFVSAQISVAQSPPGVELFIEQEPTRVITYMKEKMSGLFLPDRRILIPVGVSL